MSTLVALDGALNFRDVGGYAAADGRRVRTGMVFRSDHLHDLTDDDLDEVASLGVRTVVDFRRDDEVTERPSRLWPTVTNHVRLPMADLEGRDDFMTRVWNGEVAEVTDDVVSETYREILDQHAPSFGHALRLMADLDEVPLVFHCTAGKDRTGLAAMLLHRLLGVSHEDVLADFELTNRYRSPRRIEALRPVFAERGLDIERFRPALTAPPAAMRAALDHLDGQGGVEAYLTGPAAVGTDAIEALRAQMLVRPR